MDILTDENSSHPFPKDTQMITLTKDKILDYLKAHKREFAQKHHITSLGLYGSFARDEAGEESDVDIFYESDSSFSMGLFEFNAFVKKIEDDLKAKIDFVSLDAMNPIIKHYAKKDFIYVSYIPETPNDSLS